MITDFLIHSRLVWNQWVKRSTTTSYLQGCLRSKGSMVTRSTSKRTLSPSMDSGQVEPVEDLLETDRPADVRSQGQSDLPSRWPFVTRGPVGPNWCPHGSSSRSADIIAQGAAAGDTPGTPYS